MTHAALLAAFGEESAIALLLRLANDPTIGIRDRVDAGRALARLGDERAASILVTLADYDDPEGDIQGHMRAARALALLPRYRAKAAAALIKIATDTTVWDNRTRVDAAVALASLDGYRARGAELLTVLAEGESIGRYARGQARQSLTRLRDVAVEGRRDVY